MTPILSFSVKAEELKIEEAEVLRYLGYKRNEVTEEDKLIVRETIAELRASISGKGCFGRFPVSLSKGGFIEMPYGKIQSRDLSVNLKNCSEIYLAAVTIGAGFDRALRKAEKTSIAKAAICQAVGATAVEDVLDILNARLTDAAALEDCRLRPRYSPGFGDFRLDQQKGIFSVLNPEKHAGITLMNTLIMAPEKSVTAVIGIEPLAGNKE